MTDVVMDASALLAAIQDESGAERVEHHLEAACIGAANLAEVVGTLQDRGMSDSAIDAVLAELDLDVRPLDEPLAVATGKLRRETRSHGLSLGDRACLALAHSLGAKALTSDRAWQNLSLPVEIEVIR